MEDWIREQIKLHRTIYIYNNVSKYTKCAFNDSIYSNTFLTFLKYIYKPNTDIIFSDLHGINKSWTNFTTRIYYRSPNAPINTNKIYEFLDLMDILVKNNDIDIFNQILQFFENCTNSIWSEHADENQYYIFYLLCWLEHNLNSLLGIIDIQLEYKKLNKNDNYQNIMYKLGLINHKITVWFEQNIKTVLCGCLQLKSFRNKWRNNIIPLL